jgi:MerR family transcriptional regulator, light-induced transcriptional regulator
VEEVAVADEYLNLKQVSVELQVHYMTVYRYVRQGRLEAERDGTSWRVSRAALTAFSQPSPVASDEPGAPWAGRLEACLLTGDEPSAWAVIERALAAGHTPEYAYLEMIAASLAAIGDGWACGDFEIADQHIATAVAQRLVARLGARFRRSGRSRGTVVFGAPTGELHALPIALVSDLVRLRGFDVLELGANVPAEAFASAATRAPRLVCVGIGVTQPKLLASVQMTVDAVRAMSSVPIVVGGLAVEIVDAILLQGVDAIARGGRDAVELVEGFAGTSVRQVG